VLRKC